MGTAALGCPSSVARLPCPESGSLPSFGASHPRQRAVRRVHCPVPSDSSFSQSISRLAGGGSSLPAHCSRASACPLRAPRIPDVGRSLPHLRRLQLLEERELRRQPRASASGQIARDPASAALAAERAAASRSVLEGSRLHHCDRVCLLERCVGDPIPHPHGSCASDVTAGPAGLRRGQRNVRPNPGVHRAHAAGV